MKSGVLIFWNVRKFKLSGRYFLWNWRLVRVFIDLIVYCKRLFVEKRRIRVYWCGCYGIWSWRFLLEMGKIKSWNGLVWVVWRIFCDEYLYVWRRNSDFLFVYLVNRWIIRFFI